MGSLLIQNIPTGTGELIRVDTLPLVVEPNQSFEDAKQLLEQMVASAGSLANSITTEEDYNRGMKMLQGLKLFLKNIDEGVKPAKDRINEGKDRLMSFIHELDVPAKNLQAALAKETGRFKLWQEEQVRLENERRQREAEAERQRLQREADLRVLQVEIDDAMHKAALSTGRGQLETSAEITAGLKPIVTKLKVPQSIADPLRLATEIRQLIVLALQHEAARMAAAQAKAEGDKKAAAAILRASAKLEAPVVEEVRAEQIQAAPVMVRQPDLFQAKGASVRQNWRVKSIFDPGRVCREHPELCEPSQSKLNDLAKRLKAKPNVGGVEWENEVKTIGVR